MAYRRQSKAISALLARPPERRRRAKQRLARDKSAAWLAAQNGILKLISRGAPVPEILDAAARLIEKHEAPARCAITLFDGERRLRHAATTGLPDGLADAIARMAPGTACSPWGQAVATRRAVTIADLAASAKCPVFCDAALAANLRACRIYPILTGGSSFGTFFLLYPTPDAAEASDGKLLDLIIPTVKIALDMDQRSQALQSADERFKSLAASVPGVVYQRLVTPGGDIRYTYISEGVRDLFGITPAEVLADPQALFSRHDPSYSATFRERLLSASRSLEMWDVEATIISRDGRQKYTHAIARPHAQPDGSVLWNGLILDQTRIKKAELAAAAAEAQTREAIIESLSQGLALFDASDRLMVCNSAFLKLYTRLHGTALPGAPYEVIARGELEQEAVTPAPALEEKLRARLEQHRARQHTLERQLADGRWVLVSERRMADGGTVVLHTDITALKRREEERAKLQDQLYRAQKMEAMGRLAGGIAHDFNNLLASILGNAGFLVEDLPQGSETWEFAEQIRTAGERAKHLVQQILAFSRQREAERTYIDPARIIDETVQLLRAALPKLITLKVHNGADDVTISGNSTQLVQVLVNLCVNARDAIGTESGTIQLESDVIPPLNRDGATGTARVASRHAEPEDAPGMQVTTAPRDPAKQYLRIRVRDTGCGMDRATMERMFEPFFTTKEVGKGTGLGLAAVHGIVSAHGGVVSAMSRRGVGTTFEVLIPTVAARPTIEASAEAAMPRGSEAILIVDDEHQVAATLARTLERLGYEVTCFSSASAAIEALRQAEKNWALAITDHMMPQMTGLEFAKRAQAQFPRLPIILCSGYTDSVSSETMNAAGIAAFLAKPVDHGILARTIRELLDRRAEGRSPRTLASDVAGTAGPPAAARDNSELSA